MDRINKSIRNRNGAILERRSYTTCQVNIKDKRVRWLFILWVSRWMRFGRLYHNYPLGMIVCVEKDVAKYTILYSTRLSFIFWYIYTSVIHLVMMPCCLPVDNIISCKLICMYPQNHKRYGLSTHIVYILVFDATSGRLMSILVSFILEQNYSLIVPKIT